MVFKEITAYADITFPVSVSRTRRRSVNVSVSGYMYTNSQGKTLILKYRPFDSIYVCNKVEDAFNLDSNMHMFSTITSKDSWVIIPQPMCSCCRARRDVNGSIL